MKQEKITEIIHKYDKTPQKLVRAFHKKTTMIDPMDYHKIASEICQEQEEEMKEAVELLKIARCPYCQGGFIATTQGTSLCSWCFKRDQFIQEHENK